MLKIIFYSCYGLGMDYLWHGLRTLSLPHHSIPFFNVFGCRLLGYWWLWMLIIHLLLIWFSMRWSDFILTALRLGSHTFVLFFRFFFLLFPSTTPLSTWITREMTFDLKRFFFCLFVCLFVFVNYNLDLLLVFWSFFCLVFFYSIYSSFLSFCFTSKKRAYRNTFVC